MSTPSSSPVKTRLTAGVSPFSGWAMPMLPSQCAVCGRWPARQVCSDCADHFSSATPRCRTCAIALPTDLSEGRRPHPGHCAECIASRPPLDACVAALSYGYPWAGLIARYKFGDRPGWARFFAERLLDAPGTRDHLMQLEASDWIVPLPLSRQRLQTRGFNQSWEMAKRLGALSRSRGTADAGLLLRIRDTPPQTELRRDARVANVRGAFAVEPLRAHLLKGRRVVLVDDVMTSGASLFAAAVALREAGASHITGLALARTAAP